MPTNTSELGRAPSPVDLARRAQTKRTLSEHGITYSSGGVDASIGALIDRQSREKLLALREQLIADELSGITHDAIVTPVESSDAAVLAFGGEETDRGRWGGDLFRELSEQGFASNLFTFATDKTIDAGDKHSRIEINNRLTYMVSELRDEEGTLTAAVAEPTEYEYGNATLVWRVGSGVPLFEALNPQKGRGHARTDGKCRAVNHTRTPDGQPDYDGHMRRIQERLSEPIEQFLR